MTTAMKTGVSEPCLSCLEEGSGQVSGLMTRVVCLQCLLQDAVGTREARKMVGRTLGSVRIGYDGAPPRKEFSSLP